MPATESSHRERGRAGPLAVTVPKKSQPRFELRPKPSADKPALFESDILDKFIRPAMEAAGWNSMDQIYRAFPRRAGRVVVHGQKAYRDKATVDFGGKHGKTQASRSNIRP